MTTGHQLRDVHFNDSCEPYLEQGAVICCDQGRLDEIADGVSNFGFAGIETS